MANHGSLYEVCLLMSLVASWWQLATTTTEASTSLIQPSLSTQLHPSSSSSTSSSSQEPILGVRDSGDGKDGRGSLLPDRPLQLVQPDPTEHRRLVVVEENLKHLHHVNSAVAVVAVVGKYHSGKSFLMNQLMGKKNGFGIGPSLQPQTMGIWMWGEPLEMTVANGSQNLSVIFLDTEGFAASNISESYDAKIFAVATLLSSYLLYNSVKIIDQADIDYLELLARRTRLFALRSQITKSKWFDSFNHDLLQFPPLIWVVQDFVQMTEGPDSPKEWLHRMMSSSSRESDHYISLLELFESVDCHTLFIPASKKTQLQDLSQVSEEELTPEYREERDALLNLIRTNLIPKEKNGKPITGAELASLVGVLVHAANEGSLAEVPGRWEAFVDQLHTSSVEDCITFYETQMNELLLKYNHGPINTTELEIWHRTAQENSLNLLEKLLFGLHNATAQGEVTLRKAISERFEWTNDMNQKRIELRCGEEQRKVELKVEEALGDVVSYPMKTTYLRKLFHSVRTEHLSLYRERLETLSDHTSYQRHLDQLEVGIERIFHGAELKNEQAMETVLSAAIKAAAESFRRESENVNQIPRTTLALETVIVAATNTALQVFQSESELAHEEKIFRVYTDHCKSTLSDEAQSLEQDNLNLVRASCQLKSADLERTFRHNTDPKKLSFPLNESELERQLDRERQSAYEIYYESQGNFDDTSAYMDVKKELVSSIDNLCKQRRKENYQAYIREVETPLKTAKKSILLSADMFDTKFSLNRYMEKICLLQLDEGKAKLWQKSLKRSIIAHYISSQPDLQRLLASKEGWWANVKGFFQWLYSLIVG